MEARVRKSLNRLNLAQLHTLAREFNVTRASSRRAQIEEFFRLKQRGGFNQEQLESLPVPALIKIMKRLDYEQVMTICRNSREIFEKVCRLNQFWMEKLAHDFGAEWLDYPRFKTGTWKHNYELVHIFKFLAGLGVVKNFDQMKGLTTLFLNDKRLTSLPESIGHLTNLELLYLAYNRLTSLPESIGKLSRLRWLGLKNNQLTSLPESIGHLNALGKLNLSNNQLTSLPNSIGNLSNLRWLDLYNNQLTSLPESIGNLTLLKRLNLEHNQLTNLPESIGNLTNLRWLDLYNNQLTSLPESIGNLTNLRWFNLVDNQLTSLPNSIGNLTTLETLILAYNKLTGLPESIVRLTSLRWFDLVNNRLTSLPESIGNLTNLRLDLRNNQLTSLPDSIGKIYRPIFEEPKLHKIWLEKRHQYLKEYPEALTHSLKDYLIKQGLFKQYNALPRYPFLDENPDLSTILPNETDQWQFHYFMWVRKAPTNLSPDEAFIQRLKCSFINEASFRATLENLPTIIKRFNQKSFKTFHQLKAFVTYLIPDQMNRPLGWSKAALTRAITSAGLEVNNFVQTKVKRPKRPRVASYYEKKLLMLIYLMLKYQSDAAFRELIKKYLSESRT